MFTYLIPFFVLLLVVAVVLKQREKKQAANESEAVSAKAKSKNTTDTKPAKSKLNAKNRKAKTDTKTAAPAAERRASVTPVAPELQQKLQQLIHGGHFSTAEAHINQALNRDASQHELYLILLKVHLLQKDELATNQLINHIRSLNVPDLLAEAEAKRHEHEQLQTIQHNYLTDNQLTDNHATDHHLTDNPTVDRARPKNPFAQLHTAKHNISNTAATSTAPTDDNQALFDFSEFDFDDDNSATTTQPANATPTSTAAHNANDALFADFLTPTSTTAAAPVTDLNASTAQPLNQDVTPSGASSFNFSFDPDQNKSDNTAPNTALPNTATFDAAQPDLTKPDLTKIDLAKPDLTTTGFSNDAAASFKFDLSPTTTGDDNATSDVSLSLDDSTASSSNEPSYTAQNSSKQNLDFDLSNFSFGLAAPESDSSQLQNSSDQNSNNVETAAPALSLSPNTSTALNPTDSNEFRFSLSDAATASDRTEAERVAADHNPEAARADDSDRSDSHVLAWDSSVSDTAQQTSSPTANHTVSHFSVTDHQAAGFAQPHFDPQDALIQQFPELNQISVQQLDLQLAQYYTDYAVPDAAQQLLQSIAAQDLNSAQQQQLAQLKQQLAEKVAAH